MHTLPGWKGPISRRSLCGEPPYELIANREEALFEDSRMIGPFFYFFFLFFLFTTLLRRGINDRSPCQMTTQPAAVQTKARPQKGTNHEFNHRRSITELCRRQSPAPALESLCRHVFFSNAGLRANYAVGAPLPPSHTILSLK